MSTLSRSAPLARPRQWSRFGLGWHALAAAVILLSVRIAAGPGWFSVDEGALEAELDTLSRHGHWGLSTSWSGAGSFPITKSAQLTDGTWAPYSNRALFTRVLALVWGVSPAVVKLLPMVALILAALFVAGLTTHGRVLAFWLLIASPLFFDSQLLMGHTMGALGIAGMAWGSQRRFRAWPTLVLAGAALAVAARTESLIVVAMLGLVLLLRHRRGALAVVLLAFVGAVAAKVATTWLTPGFAPSTTAVPGEGVGFSIAAGQRLHQLGDALFRPTSNALTSGSWALVLLAATAAAIGWQVRRGRARHDRMAMAAVGISAVLIMATRSEGVPGLVMAWPIALVIVVGVVCGSRQTDSAGPKFTAIDPLLLAGMGAMTVLALIQYRQGGGAEFGFRYSHVAIPLLVPSIAGYFRRHVDRPMMRIAIGTIVVAPLVAQASLVLRSHAAVQRVQSAINNARGVGAGHVIVISDYFAVGRLVWRPFIENPGAFVSPSADFDSVGLAAAADDAAAMVWVFATGPDHIPEMVGPYTLRSAVEPTATVTVARYERTLVRTSVKPGG